MPRSTCFSPRAQYAAAHMIRLIPSLTGKDTMNPPTPYATAAYIPPTAAASAQRPQRTRSQPSRLAKIRIRKLTAKLSAKTASTYTFCTAHYPFGWMRTLYNY